MHSASRGKTEQKCIAATKHHLYNAPQQHNIAACQFNTLDVI